MASIEVPPLIETLGQIPDFRCARGKRHPLQAVLALACVAMLGGARSESAIAEWGVNHGLAWRRRLGLIHARGPSQATIHRLFRGIDVALLEAHLGRWAEQVLARVPAATTGMAPAPWRGLPATARPCGGATTAARSTPTCLAP